MDEKTRVVAYYRLPAGSRGAGFRPLDGQRQAVSAYLEGGDRDLVGEFTEVMHPVARDGAAPAFDLALECCGALDAILIAAVTEADIGHDALTDARRRGIAVHLIQPRDAARPAAPPAEAPSLALRGARRPPVPLPGIPPRGPAGNREKADRFARAILPIIEQIRATGATTLSDIADELNARHVRTARGRRWYPTTVRNILGRLPDDAAG